MDCNPLGSSVHRILQARLSEWVAISSSGGSSWPRDRTRISHIEGSSLTTEPERIKWLREIKLLAGASTIQSCFRWFRKSELEKVLQEKMKRGQKERGVGGQKRKQADIVAHAFENACHWTSAEPDPGASASGWTVGPGDWVPKTWQGLWLHSCFLNCFTLQLLESP